MAIRLDKVTKVPYPDKIVFVFDVYRRLSGIN